MANIEQFSKSKYKKEIPTMVRECEAMRRNSARPLDISLAQYVQDKLQLSMPALYKDLGLDPSCDTIQNIVNLPDESVRWLIPEIFRDAVRLGLRKAPIYPNLIQSEQSVSQLQVTMPAINMSEAVPHRLGPAQTIPVGDVSFGQKSVRIYKCGRGIKVPYEVIQYVSLNIVSIYLQDFGIKLGMGLDVLALNTLQNGDQADGSDSTAVIGIIDANSDDTMVYRDLLRMWVRMGRLGKVPNTMVAGEEMAMDILELIRYNTLIEGRQRSPLTVRTPIPDNSNLYVHGNIPNDQVLIVDPSSALIKLNAQPLLVESERIVSNQTEATYVTTTTGFATIYRDSRLILDKTLAFATNGFPDWMNPALQENVIIQ